MKPGSGHRLSLFWVGCLFVVLACSPAPPGDPIDVIDVPPDVPEVDVPIDVPELPDIPDGEIVDIECHQDADCADFFPEMAACQIARCDNPTGAGMCVLDAAPEDTVCDDDDLCTLDDACAEGICGGTPRVCDDGVDCTTDHCSAETGECDFVPSDFCECI